jgi:hypothetical protein
MPKKPVSVTLDADNLVWLKGRAVATGVRSVSELLDRLVTQARAAGTHGPARSVVGTIDIDPDDPWLEHADSAVRAAFDRSVNRPMRVKAASPPDGSLRPKKKRHG